MVELIIRIGKTEFLCTFFVKTLTDFPTAICIVQEQKSMLCSKIFM